MNNKKIKITPKILERFWSKTKIMHNGCWEWQFWKDKDGYGGFKFNGKTVRAHRFAHEVTKGEIPFGLTIDHLCRNTKCVNPDHLEVVTSKENTLRGEGQASKNAKKTHCPKGHRLKGSNLIQFQLKQYGKRKCRICFNTQQNDRKRKLRN